MTNSKQAKNGAIETRRDKFVRLAESRTNKIIDQIELLGNLSNKSVYEYSEDDVTKIFSRLDKELKNARTRFDEKESKTKRFKL